MRNWAGVAAVCIGLALGLAQPVSAKDLIVKVGGAPGSNGDAAARLIASHIGRFLKDNPPVIVQNVTGAGGLILARMIQSAEPNDGSVIAVTSLNQVLAGVLEPASTGLVPDRFKWIGALSEETGVCLVRADAGINTVEDFRTKSFKLGATTKTSAAYIEAALVKKLLGAKYEIVTGFSGGPETNLAITRGEIAGGCGASLYTFWNSEFSRDKKLIGYAGPPPRGEFVKLGLPSFGDLVVGERDKRAYALLTSVKYAVFPIAVPPTTPDSVVDALRTAFNSMVADPKFLQDAQRIIPELRPSTGQQVDATVRNIAGADADVVKRARELVE